MPKFCEHALLYFECPWCSGAAPRTATVDSGQVQTTADDTIRNGPVHRPAWDMSSDGMYGCIQMADDEAVSRTAKDITPEGVQRRVLDTVDDAINGRLTKPQREILGTAIERTERVSPDADNAVRRAITR